MPVMIQVTLEDGKGYINANSIQAIATVGGETRVYIDGYPSFITKETPEEIVKLIEKETGHVGFVMRGYKL